MSELHVGLSEATSSDLDVQLLEVSADHFREHAQSVRVKTSRIV